MNKHSASICAKALLLGACVSITGNQTGTIKCKYFINTKVRSKVQSKNDWFFWTQRRQKYWRPSSHLSSVSRPSLRNLWPRRNALRKIFLKWNWVRKHVGKLDILKSTDPNRKHPWVLRELAHARMRLLIIVFERLWQSREVHENQKKANLTPVFKQGSKEDPGTYRPVSLSLIPEISSLG